MSLLSFHIARSQVFAQLLADDLGADKHFLIGSNLDDLQNYIDEAWDNFIADFTASDSTLSNSQSLEKILLTFIQISKRLRVPMSQQQLTQWFKSRFVIVPDFYTSGDQLIQIIAQNTPAGLTNRIMGLQNIKGTGLDFVYRWQAWGRTHALCEQPTSHDELVAKQAVAELARIQDFGPLDQRKVLTSIELIKHLPIAQSEQFQAEIGIIEDNLRRLSVNDKQQDDLKISPSKLYLIDFIESLLDPGQAIKRRKAANQIYQDLAAERISHARAAIELQSLNKKQKGGWLRKKLLKDQ